MNFVFLIFYKKFKMDLNLNLYFFIDMIVRLYS